MSDGDVPKLDVAALGLLNEHVERLVGGDAVLRLEQPLGLADNAPVLHILVQPVGLPAAASAASCARPAAVMASSEAADGMPEFMDVHDGMPGITMEGLHEAHQADLTIQGEEGVDFKRAWADPVSGKVVCLSEAPSADAVKADSRAGRAPDGPGPQGIRHSMSEPPGAGQLRA